MSQIKIRAALETALNGMTPSVLTAWENQPFTPPAQSVPYQACHVLFAAPDNLVYGSEYREQGFMQVRLMYPQQTGTGAAIARAELIRSTFARGETFTNGGVNVLVSETPEIMPGIPEDGRFSVAVRIRFFAQITS